MGVLAKLGLATLVAVAAFLYQRAATEVYKPENIMTNKNVLITGGSAGLGLESAKRLAAAGANIIITARNKTKGQKAVQAIQEYSKEQSRSYPGQSVGYKILQLDELESVKQAASWDLPAIHVLMNNAGVAALPGRQLTVDGLERQFHTNHLGHFVLTAVLANKLAPDCRIINVSSAAHRQAYNGLDFDYIWLAEEESYSRWGSYGQSKLANIYFAQELQRRSKEKGLNWKVTSLHPGEVHTDIMQKMTTSDTIKKLAEVALFWGSKIGVFFTVATGANTQVYLAATNDEIVGGGYYDACKLQKLGEFATNQTARERLWKESEERAGIQFSFPSTA